MNLPDINSNDSSNSIVVNPIASIILYALSWLFIYFQSISADFIWTWTWKALSAISLIFIIYINWHKVIEIRNNKKMLKK